MAFTRKFLAALGIEQDKIEEIINAHTEVTDALKQERDQYKVDADKLPGITKELEDLKKSAEEAEGKNSWKVKYDALKEDFDNYKTSVAENESKAKKSAAYKALLKQAGIPEKRLDTVLRVSDINAVVFDDSGNVRDTDKLIESIKSEWSDFIQTPGMQGANTENPPANSGNTFDSMSLSEKMAFANEHPNDPAVSNWLKN